MKLRCRLPEARAGGGEGWGRAPELPGRAAAAAGDLLAAMAQLGSITIAVGLSVLVYAQNLNDGSGEHCGVWVGTATSWH